MKAIITIGMPVFNDIDFIEQSIVSILNQSEKRFILIISDDGASDGSEEICKKYASIDQRIKYIRQEKNLGISRNMEFLIAQSGTEYFMWAADDDLWHQDFISEHISNLEKDYFGVVSFGQYDLIDEDNFKIATVNVNYSSFFRIVQLFKLMWYFEDGFGYGVFRTERIKTVRFPIWWWPNKKTPYNNIYPSLAYYLNRGRYLHSNKILFYKRVKVGNKVNHQIGGSGNGISELLAFYCRRFYLVCFSTVQILKSFRFWNAIILFPFILGKWFIYDSLKMTIESIFNKFR